MTNKAEIEWVDRLPNSRAAGRRTATKTFVEALKAKPGTWAVYQRRPKGKKWTAASVYAKNHPGTEWTSRVIGGRVTVYARWVGKRRTK